MFFIQTMAIYPLVIVLQFPKRHPDAFFVFGRCVFALWYFLHFLETSIFWVTMPKMEGLNSINGKFT